MADSEVIVYDVENTAHTLRVTADIDDTEYTYKFTKINDSLTFPDFMKGNGHRGIFSKTELPDAVQDYLYSRIGIEIIRR